MINTFQKNSVFEISIDNRKLLLRPRVNFEYDSRDQFEDMLLHLFYHYDSAYAIAADSSTVMLDNIYSRKSEVEEFVNNENTYFTFFLDAFNSQNEFTQLGFLGDFHTSDYYFNKNVFLINGYYNIDKSVSADLKRWYIMKIGVKFEDGFYFINFNLPIRDDFNDIKLLNSLIQGVKIVK